MKLRTRIKMNNTGVIMFRVVLISILPLLLFVSCGEMKDSEHTDDPYRHVDPAAKHELDNRPDTTTFNRAVAVLHPTGNNKIKGVITFTREGTAVRVQGRIEGLSEGKHGFHVHQFGDCSAVDAASAGDHFNPTDQPHGEHGVGSRHAGDFGNIEAGADGVANVDFLDHMITFSGNSNIIGRSLIVHQNEDDLTSQPSGNAGPRVACGIIGIAAE
jgi:superoxide dismutase, Cu-Zn family